jgi:hypothetical protein
MTRPDWELLRRNSEYVYAGAGECMTLRVWVSAGGGSPQYGVQAQNYYTETMLTGLLKQYDPRLAALQGGNTQTDMLFVTLPIEMRARDELVYRGSAYRADGNADPETFGAGRVLYHTPLRLANITG